MNYKFCNFLSWTSFFSFFMYYQFCIGMHYFHIIHGDLIKTFTFNTFYHEVIIFQ